jgi:hypothetical protein
MTLGKTILSALAAAPIVAAHPARKVFKEAILRARKPKKKTKRS